jgi:hypothetical protein
MKPEKVFRVGSVSASVFKNTVETQNGKRDMRNVALQRAYRDGEEWKNTSTFGLAEVPQALAVLDLALRYLSNKEADVTP